MNSDSNPKFDAHIFVCTNERSSGHPRGCCKSKGADEVLKALKLALAKEGLGSRVRAQRAGCLDACEDGISAVIYPEGIWLKQLTEDQIPQVVREHVLPKTKGKS